MSAHTDSASSAPPAHGASHSGLPTRSVPPVIPVSAAALISVVAGGVHMASHFPRNPPLTIPVVLLAVGSACMLANVVLLARLKEFAWKRFFIVYKWSLLAYVISAGMIEFAFLENDASGDPLVVVSLMLVIFATVVPLMIAFTVARYEEPETTHGST